MIKLSVQAGTGTFSNEQKAMMDAEFKELADEINRIASNTQFNGNYLLDSDGRQISVSIGAGSSIDIVSRYLGLDVSGLDLTGDADGALAVTTDLLQQVCNYRGYLGAQSNRLADAVAVMEVDIENAMAVESRISDTDIAFGMASHASGRIRAEMAVAVQGQANATHQTVLQLLK
jgi:flagellin